MLFSVSAYGYPVMYILEVAVTSTIYTVRWVDTGQLDTPDINNTTKD